MQWEIVSRLLRFTFAGLFSPRGIAWLYTVCLSECVALAAALQNYSILLLDEKIFIYCTVNASTIWDHSVKVDKKKLPSFTLNNAVHRDNPLTIDCKKNSHFLFDDRICIHF